MANGKTKQKMNPECGNYRLDIVDLATGESDSLNPDRVKKVLKHIAECQSCREAFLGYEEIYAQAVTEEHTKTPEFKKKMDDLISRIKSGDETGRPKSEAMTRIMQDADMISKILEKGGEQMALPDLAGKSKLPTEKLHQAIGYLVCTERIDLNDRGADTLIQLR